MSLAFAQAWRYPRQMSRTNIIVDVSEWTGSQINWRALADAGVTAAYVKAQNGNDGPNPHYDQQVSGAMAAGLVVGAYLAVFPLPEDQQHAGRSPADQVSEFWRSSGGLGIDESTLPPMLDCEWPEASEWSRYGCSAASIAQWIESAGAFVDQQWRRRCGIYCDADWWGSLGGAGLLSCFALRPLWLAEYPVPGVQLKPPAKQPTAPRPWQSVQIWQFTGDFVVPASGCRADGSVFCGDDAAWRRFITP